MSIFEYMSMVVAIVLGISITNLLNKLAITLRVGSWGTLWFRPLWCVILLICTIGYLWAFWRIYVDYTEISIWSFIFGPFFTVVCFFLISVLLPIPRESGTDSDAFDVFLEQKIGVFFCMFDHNLSGTSICKSLKTLVKTTVFAYFAYVGLLLI